LSHVIFLYMVLDKRHRVVYGIANVCHDRNRPFGWHVLRKPKITLKRVGMTVKKVKFEKSQN